MPGSGRLRLSALVAAASVVAATLLPALPAVADDLPVPSPTGTVEPTSSPTPDPTATPEPTTPDPTASPEPTGAPTGSPAAPSPHSAPPAAASSFTGTLVATATLGSGLKLTAAPSGLSVPAGTITYKYQWYRVIGAAAGVAIAGATTASYTLVAADVATSTYVRITATSPGFTTATADSTPHGYSVVPTPLVPVLSGEQRVGIDLTVGAQTYTLDGSTITPDVTYSWFRDGVAIPGTSGTAPVYAHYTPTSADAGKAITVKATAALAGFQSSVATSAPTSKLTSFSLPGYETALPAVVHTPGTLKLTLPGTGITAPGVTTAYQWLRNGAAISGATASSYTMTAADAAKLVSVRVTVSKALYTNAVKYSPGVNYSIRAADAVTMYLSTNADHWQFGATASIINLAVQTVNGPLSGETYAYQWLRNGAVIAGATTATYVAQVADLGTTTSVRVTATKTGYLPGTIVIGGLGGPFVASTLGTFSSGNGFAAPLVFDSAGLLNLSIPDEEITDPNPVYTYEWLHDSTTVVGTKSTYRLSAADYGHTVSVRVTVTKAHFTPKVLPESAHPDYSIVADAARTITDATHAGGFRVGDLLTTNVPNYFLGSNPFSPQFSYQWYRTVGAAAPVAIAGPEGTGANYVTQSADFGASVSVKVTAFDPFQVSLVTTTPAVGPVVAGMFEGTGAKPTVVASATGLLSVQIDPATVGMLAPVYGYKWFRQGSPDQLIATTPTFQLTATTGDVPIYVVVTASKQNVTPATFPLNSSQPHSYGMAPQSAAQISPFSAPHVGDLIGVTLPAYLAEGGAVLSPTFTYQWYRKTGTAARVKIAGAIDSTYRVTLADFGAGSNSLIVDVTSRADGLVPNTLSSSQSFPVVKGVIAGNHDAPKVTVTGAQQLTAGLETNAITESATTLAYQWYRNGSPISGATKATYTLTAADFGKPLSAAILVSKAGYTTYNLGQSPMVDYSLVRDNATIAQMVMPATGEVFSATSTTWSDSAGPVVPTSVSYQWYRKTGSAAPVVITGATLDHYELTTADYHTTISLKVTATAPGHVSFVATSPQSALIEEGVLQGVFNDATIVPNGNGSLKVNLPADFSTNTGTTITYLWTRDGIVIPGATKAAYTLVAADLGQPISAVVTVKKAHLTPAAGKTQSLADWDPSLTQVDPTGLTGMQAVGSTLTVDPGTWNGPTAVTPLIQWMKKTGSAAPVAIAGQTDTTYKIRAADLGATISVRVTPVAPGGIGVPVTQAAPTAVVKGTFTGTFFQPLVTPMSVSLIGSLLPGAVDQEADATLSYQWLRDTQPIPGKTSAEYFLSPADYGHAIGLRITVSAPGFTALPAGTIPDANGTDYSLHVDTPPILSGPTKVGEPLTIIDGTYTDTYGPASFVTTTYTWYRYKTGAPILISGQTGSSYTPTAADLGYSITARVTYGASVRVGSFVDAHAGPILPGAFTGSGSPLGVGSIPDDNTLVVSMEGGTIDQPSAVFRYQWTRNGVNISGATKSTYKLVAADWGHGISFVTTVTAPGYATIQLGTPADIDASIRADAALTINGAKEVGGVLSLAPMTWNAFGGATVPTLSGYQWMRDNVAITGAKAATYVVQPADVGHLITLKFLTSGGAVIGRVETTQPTPAITQGTFTGSMIAPLVTEDTPTMTLTGALAGGSVDQTGLTLAYQWLRDGANIAGATKAAYKLVALDNGANIQVRITFSKPGYTAHAPLTSNLASYTLGAATTASIQAPHNPPRNGDTLISNAIVYNLPPSSITFQWYQRTGAAGPLVPIVGNLGTGSTYHVVSADVGKFIVLQVTATYPGYFSNVQTAVSAVLPIDP